MAPGMGEDTCNSRGLRALRHEQVKRVPLRMAVLALSGNSGPHEAY